MKTRRKFVRLALLLVAAFTGPLAAQNTVVTYQGRVQSGGSDFTGTGQFKFALVTTTNTSAQATATASIVLFGGVTGINITFGGSGYVTPPTVSITGGGGSGATATAFISGGVVTSIQVNNPGTGYTFPPSVTIAAPPPSVAYLTHWSNDGTSSNGSEPTAAVTLTVNHGLFTARLGDATLANMTAFGAGLFTQPNLLLRIWFSDGTNALALLTPPQPLTAAPYAAVAGNASSLSGGTYSNAVTFNNPANSFGGSGASLTALNASQLTSGTVPNARLAASVSLLGQTIESSEITDGTIQPADVNAASFSTTFWRTAGNGGTTAGTHFLGTTDSQPVEFKVNALRALRLEDKGDGSDSGTIPDGAPNIVSGSPGNFVGAGVVGATIGGGGALNWEGFAQTNTVLSDYAVVGGGLANRIERDAIGAAIGGGRLNRILTNSWFGHIGGGFDNTIASSNRQATIAGGSSNEIGANSESSTVGGGVDNQIAGDSPAATIAGGNANDIGSSSDHSTIGGGYENDISSTSSSSTIAGGVSNDIGVNSFYSTIGGGSDNNIGNNAVGATVGGGVSADLGNGATYSTVGGGYDNNITASGQYATIPGGAFNSAANYAFAAGYRAKANHQGAFVWADSTAADFASTTANQFNVRASGGVRFVTSGAGLTVDSDVGIGETAPEGQLHITGPQTTPQIKIETTATDSFVKLRLESLGKPFWDFAVGGSGNVMNWYYSGTAQNLMTLSTSGTLTTAGPVNPPSDRNVKQDFAAVDALAVLEKVATLPIQSWAYKNSPDTRHIGPVAQDFHAAFQFNGADDKHISTVDADGVALAAIQGLNQKLEQKETEITELKRQNQSLEQRLAALERVVLSQTAK